MQRVVRLAGAAALSVLWFPLAGGSASAASTTWAATVTRAETPAAWAGLVDGSALSAAKTMTVTVSLPLRNRAGLNALIAGRRTVTPAQFDARYAPTSATVGTVTRYLTGARLTRIAVTSNHLLVSATGTVAAIDSAFHTTLDSVTYKGAKYFANTVGASVPTSLAGDVTAVLGLEDLPVTHLDPAATTGAKPGIAAARAAARRTTAERAATKATTPAVAAPASSCLTTVGGLGVSCEYEPQDLQTAYNANTINDASKTSIAIFGEGDVTQVVADYNQAKSEDSLPDAPISVIVPPQDTTSTDTTGADEFDLDTQLSSGMAQDVQHLYLYDASSLGDQPLIYSYNDFVTPPAGASEPLAKDASASFGGCESLEYLGGDLATEDEVFAEAAAQGQTVFASSGDTGTACEGLENGVPAAGVPGVEYPASSQYVVGVGGTSLLTDSPSYAYSEELAWVGSGGGSSTVEPAPAWQTTAADQGYTGVEADTVAAASGLKTVPDIADDADPNVSAAYVDVAGTYEGIGGTSLASPMALGEWARLESYYGNDLGFAAPILYKLAGTTAIHDVSLGDAGVQPATPGYDLATGIGTLDLAAAEQEITTLGLNAPPYTSPPTNLPETPLAFGLPLAAVAIFFGGARILRRRQAAA